MLEKLKENKVLVALVAAAVAGFAVYSGAVDVSFIFSLLQSNPAS